MPNPRGKIVVNDCRPAVDHGETESIRHRTGRLAASTLRGARLEVESASQGRNPPSAVFGSSRTSHRGSGSNQRVHHRACGALAGAHDEIAPTSTGRARDAAALVFHAAFAKTEERKGLQHGCVDLFADNDCNRRHSEEPVALNIPAKSFQTATLSETGTRPAHASAARFVVGRHAKWTRWFCECGHSWNAFDTGGVCLACLHQWSETQCLSCSRWSPHLAWYSK